ncbi:MAG: carbohydrate-binding protein [Fibrobacteraceae bacterium]|nr:carbohydrate-binding protein [Fibrobacteraceae bacterium]
MKTIKKPPLETALALARASFAENPIINYHYLADPSAVVVGDRLFIIADTDDESGSDGYTIKAYYALSTKDMVNGTNHGEVLRVPRDVSWASGAWVPAVAYGNTNEGPASIGNFDPYDSIPATTGSLMQNVASRTDLVTSAPPRSLLIPKPKTGTSWYRISNVDFGSGGATKFTVNAASLNADNAVEIRTGSATGTLAGTCKLASTGSWSTYATTECAVSGLTGVVSQMYLVFTGTADSTAALLWWKMVSAPTVPQGPYADTLAIPGTIEAEDYDVGGAGYAYYDETSANEGDADFRTTESVDIVSGNSSKAVGYTIAGEWFEYTVNVAKAGTYSFEATVDSGSKSSSFQLFLDDDAITGTVKVDSSSWTAYSTASGTTKALTAGTHVLKIAITGSYVNSDKIVFSDEITKLMKSPKKSKGGESKKNKALRQSRQKSRIKGVSKGCFD